MKRMPEVPAEVRRYVRPAGSIFYAKGLHFVLKTDAGRAAWAALNAQVLLRLNEEPLSTGEFYYQYCMALWAWRDEWLRWGGWK